MACLLDPCLYLPADPFGIAFSISRILLLCCRVHFDSIFVHDVQLRVNDVMSMHAHVESDFFARHMRIFMPFMYAMIMVLSSYVHSLCRNSATVS